MLSESELKSLLSDTPLASRLAASIEVPGLRDRAIAIDIGGLPGFAAWESVRGRLGEAGPRPLLTMFHSERTNSWQAQAEEADLFSRFYFEEEQRAGRLDDGPAAILLAASQVDLARELVDRGDELGAEEFVDIALEATQRAFGRAPAVDSVFAFLRERSAPTLLDLEEWLFDWEIAHCEDPLALPQDGLVHMQWYEPEFESKALLLMPVSASWEIPAYINFFGSSRYNSQIVVAALKAWHRDFGAELVAHFGTMMQFAVRRRPSTAREAFELARQHYLLAQCTTILPGVSVRDHARALMHTDRWFLHERP